MSGPALHAGARLDVELVRRGLVRSRGRAVELVAEGRVHVGRHLARKPSQQVCADEDLRVETGTEYVSRGAHKLSGAIDDANALLPGRLELAGARCLDVGASTGGFTQVLLERGAAHVVAVDVGHGQLAASLRGDPRVEVIEGCNARDLDRVDHQVLGCPAVVVADLSFISLTLVVPAVLRVVGPGAHLLLMVKPQFEVGRDLLGAGGVVTDEQHRADAVAKVARACADHGGTVLAVLPSVLPGEFGNHEYFLWVRADGAHGAVQAAERPEQLYDVIDLAARSGRPTAVVGEVSP